VTSLPGRLVSTDWLRQHLREPDLRLYDCTTHLVPDPVTTFRAESGREDWAKAHVPGAAYLDLRDDLSDPTSRLRFAFPAPERFAAALSAAGVGPDARVVLYSAKSNIWATRVWWMLRAFGFDDVAVLDGGWEKWTMDGGETCATPCGYETATFVARPRAALLANKDDVAAVIGDAGACTINALSAAQHRGDGGVHYGRPGRIAGSVNVPFVDLIDRQTNAFLPVDRLRARLADAGALDAPRIITYCGGGIAATSVALVLAALGYDRVKVYDNSLTEWAADPQLPMATGA
jgi:thiosulfate/3-mercaptopyruvate sulfurtransferase